jgi:hypothetical protein
MLMMEEIQSVMNRFILAVFYLVDFIKDKHVLLVMKEHVVINWAVDRQEFAEIAPDLVHFMPDKHYSFAMPVFIAQAQVWDRLVLV